LLFLFVLLRSQLSDSFPEVLSKPDMRPSRRKSGEVF
jgi:hypothetical protein